MMTLCGRINKRFGTGGGLRLTLYDTFPEEFNPETMPLIVDIDGLDVPLWCDEFDYVGAQGASVHFADLDTERRAEELIGKEFRLELEEEELPDDEFYLEDLIGFAADLYEIGTERRLEGRVADYYDSEVNPLFALEVEGREVLVPAVDEMIGGIDFEQGRIKFILPEGLIN
nr:16S rRNA processing protein RimM [Rikenellaceae bacterium]